MTMLVPSDIPISRIWDLFFSETKKKLLVFKLKLISTMIKHHTRNNWLSPIFFSPEHKRNAFSASSESWGITEVDTDPKDRFVSFKVTPSNDRVLCLCPIQSITQEKSWLEGGERFSEGIHNYMQNKMGRTEKKIILGDLNFTKALKVLFQLWPVKTHRG